MSWLPLPCESNRILFIFAKKEMGLKKEFEDKSKKFRDIFVFAKELYLYTKYYHSPKTDEERELLTSSPYSRDLQLILHLMYRSLIVETAKLFSSSKNDKYRISSFIELLSKDGHFRKLLFPQDVIDKWSKRIDDLNSQIENVKALRDNIYAHTDHSLKIKNIDVSLSEIELLLNFAEEVLQEFYSNVLGAEYEVETSLSGIENCNILKLLAVGYKQNQDDMTREIRMQMSDMQKS